MNRVFLAVAACVLGPALGCSSTSQLPTDSTHRSADKMIDAAVLDGATTVIEKLNEPRSDFEVTSVEDAEYEATYYSRMGRRVMRHSWRHPNIFSALLDGERVGEIVLGQPSSPRFFLRGEKGISFEISRVIRPHDPDCVSLIVGTLEGHVEIYHVYEDRVELATPDEFADTMAQVAGSTAFFKSLQRRTLESVNERPSDRD